MEKSMSKPSVLVRLQPGEEPVEYHSEDIIRSEFSYKVKVRLCKDDMGVESFKFIILEPPGQEKWSLIPTFATYEQARAYIWNRVSKEMNLSFAALKAAILTDSVLPNKIRGVHPPGGYMVVCSSDGYETFMHADQAILVPMDYLDNERLVRFRDCDTEKLFKHGGQFPGIELSEVIELAESRGLLDESHVEWSESYRKAKEE